MEKRTGVVTFHGKPLTLIGPELRVGDKAPDFRAVDNDLKPTTLADFAGKVVVLSAVPSLDTPVCDMETRRFNMEAQKLGDGVQILTVSMDLPFAQKRWCGQAGVQNVRTLSDYQEASFGSAYGVLIDGLRLLARAVFVVDQEGVIRFVHIVPELTHEPDYGAVLDAVRALL
ncbi:putative thiol peroxidase [Thermodesulfomicrobium sp. WS]|uniref:thiol peroxidase n=1 Tax=Thermodesulfomicrobium sp. WS TaxID=3004129 RepID=UPI00249310C6|nr:thiol peroxidase [Thermodesulfomicrobium sp. WS]BDV01166.1 putative thiol peroxidase [Thermodesulfomicrobium sp. WS]